ncbi:TRAP transporter small permease [Allorhizobium terrae]|uniref:TRAP transporter small permease protein n=1 Tax=Allorhizobium terrae TaxID=1848972 RepID=A0A4S3ZQX6_9HYPH|nr:TRAP transporter small permease [Allorhizobium terrae]THF47988.1 TRAP transporter small permease [Allorhizobium terrae]TWD48551.1 TRAP-type C4-dicarboxylate transport system permease small subunit [Agrobacterium vitis]
MRRLIDVIWSIIDILMAVILAAMIALVFANVVLRYGFSSGIRQSVELARLWFVWIVMLGAAVVLRRGEHLAVAEFSEALMPRAVPILRRLCWIVVLVAVVMLFIGALNQTLANWKNISPLTGLPSGLFYLAGVVSAVLMASIAIVRFIDPMSIDARLPEDIQE